MNNKINFYKVFKNIYKTIPYFGNEKSQFYKKLKVLIKKKFKPYYTFVDVDKIMIGQQNGMPSDEWIEFAKDNGRISVLLADSPYTSFLLGIKKNTSLLNDDVYLSGTLYYGMAEISLKYKGSFFGARNELEILNVMRNFYSMYSNYGKDVDRNKFEFSKGHSIPGSPIKLNKIKSSDCFEIVDGHHRASILYLNGQKKIKCLIINEKNTFLQNLLFSCRQTHGDPELYQPIDKPEVKSWRVVRKCIDRFSFIEVFLSKHNLSGQIHNLIDYSCSYGWFLKEFRKNNIDVVGVEKDINAIRVGKAVYNLNESNFVEGDTYEHLLNNKNKYDIVLFLSILHHFALGKEKGSPEEILKRLDSITRKVLIIDTGQNHEEWYRLSLEKWSDDYIERKIRENTTFLSIHRIGKDTDNEGYYNKQYGRTLFACLR